MAGKQDTGDHFVGVQARLTIPNGLRMILKGLCCIRLLNAERLGSTIGGAEAQRGLAAAGSEQGQVACSRLVR